MKVPARAIAAGITLLLALTAFYSWPRRDRRPSTDAKWLQVIEFIRTADEVKTFATKQDLESEKQLIHALREAKGALRLTTDRQPLLDHLAILPQLPGDPVEAAACFCPHHFVFATKGRASLRIDICYTCASCRVKSTDKRLAGDFLIKSDAKEDSRFVFGLGAGGREQGFGCRYFAD